MYDGTYRPMPLQAQGMPQRPQMRPAKVNFSQLGDIGQNIGYGIGGGRDAVMRQRMQEYLGPQSQASWALGTQTQMPQQNQNLWQMLSGRFGR